MMVEALLSQFSPSFYPYLRGFINFFWVVGVPTFAKLFFFMKLQCLGKQLDKVAIGHHDQQHVRASHSLSNYASWKQEYFFMQLLFLPGSRETWVPGDKLSFNIVSPTLNSVKIYCVDKASKACTNA